jgi:hypothetical protein
MCSKLAACACIWHHQHGLRSTALHGLQMLKCSVEVRALPMINRFTYTPFLLQDIVDLDADRRTEEFWAQLLKVLLAASAAERLGQLHMDKLSDDAALLLCSRLVTDDAPYTFSKALLSAVLPSRLLACQQAPPRAVVVAVQSAGV